MRRGHKTTEFWMCVFSQVANIAAAVAGVVAWPIAIPISAAISGAYAITRTAVKMKSND